jgi:glucose/arabinose dehydrogenase
VLAVFVWQIEGISMKLGIRLLTAAFVCLIPGLVQAQPPVFENLSPPTTLPFPLPRMVEGLPMEERPPELATDKPAFPEQTRAPYHASGVKFQVTLITDQLRLPWAMQFLPDGNLLVTEKVGGMRIVSKTGAVSAPLTGLPPVSYLGDAGMLDLALDPDYATNNTIYFCFIKPEQNDTTRLAVAKAVLDERGLALNNVQVIWAASAALSRVPSNDQGSRIVIAKDRTMFVAVGSRHVEDQAQKYTSELGHIIHINLDGTAAKDNPYPNRPGYISTIWSRGHRSPEGLTFDAQGRLWESEHGPTGGDELNLIVKDANYGWPNYVHGRFQQSTATGGPGITEPVYYWDPVIATSGLMWYYGDMFPEWKGTLFEGGLRGRLISHLTLKNDKVVSEEPLLLDLKARVRDIKMAPDGSIYVALDDTRIVRLHK